MLIGACSREDGRRMEGSFQGMMGRKKFFFGLSIMAIADWAPCAECMLMSGEIVS